MGAALCVLAQAGEGQLKFPADYREWVFLSSGSGMTYGPLAGQGEEVAPLFDNVFVNPESYRRFLATGHWPDKTEFVLEIRRSEGHASINRGGHFQRDLAGIEVEVKDASAASGLWTFYGFPLEGGVVKGVAKAFPRSASCYACHGTNTAVENTFVQFYPTLYEIAERKGTLNPGFTRLPLSTGELLRVVKEQGWPAAEQALAETVRRAPDAAVLSERSLTRVGYGLMETRAADAAALLQWTATRYPKSANALDNLAEAYLAAGQREAAVRASRRVLQMVEGDGSQSQLSESARARLKKLE